MSSTGQVNCRLIENSWSQESLSVFNNPGIGDVLGTFLAEGTSTIELGTSQVDTVDVTNYVSDSFDSGESSISIALNAPENATSVFLRSMEHSTNTEHPWLWVTVDYTNPNGTTGQLITTNNDILNDGQVRYSNTDVQSSTGNLNITHSSEYEDRVFIKFNFNLS